MHRSSSSTTSSHSATTAISPMDSLISSRLHAFSLSASDSSRIIPGLPNDLACLCLACVPLCYHGRFKTVCKAWNVALSGRFLLDLRRAWGKSEEFLCLFRDDPSLIKAEVFDPRVQVWTLLPPMPCDPSTYGLSNFECAGVGTGLLVMGGSLFDARSFPMDRPLASSAVFRYDQVSSQWERLSDMTHPRGSFACGVSEDFVIVAGGGSRHVQFPAEGNRLSAVERYDIKEDRWHALQDLHKIRAGCVGFLLDDEFWVMGGYGDSRTIAGVLPVDEYYRDGEILNLKTGRWRKLRPMWEKGERRRLGNVAVLNGTNGRSTSIFMLEGSAIFRYNIAANRWFRESHLPHMISPEASLELIALHGELYVISGVPMEEFHHFRRKRGTLLLQIYHPQRQTWRLMFTKPPLDHRSVYPWAAMCTLRL
eukprot:c23478_g1_i1 orf=183-1451(+)